MTLMIHEDRLEGQGEPSARAAPPPSYIEATVPGASGSRPPTYNEKPTADPIDALVSRLPFLVREGQQSQSRQRSSEDDTVIQHIIPLVRQFFLELSTSNNTKRSRNSHGSLTTQLMLVPRGAAPGHEGWDLAGLNERREQSDFFRLDKVEAPDQLGGVSKDRGSAQIRDDGVEPDMLWWRDEHHALRLASALRGIVAPERSEKGEAQRRQDLVRQEAAEQPQDKAKSPVRSFFGLSRRSRPPPAEPTSPTTENMTRATEFLGSAHVDIQVEEVTFRRENDFGLWESSSGWAVIIKTTVLY